MQFHSPRQAAKILNIGPATVHRFCVRHAGFAHWLDGRWRIPEAHIARMIQNGETPAQIGRKLSLLNGNTPSAADHEVASDSQDDIAGPRHQLVQSYFCLLAARHYADEISAPSNDRLLGVLASNILGAIKALGMIEAGGLRTAIAECDALAEFRILTGISAII